MILENGNVDPDMLRRCLDLAKVCKATYAGPIRHSLYKYNKTPFQKQKIIHGSFGRGYCRIFWNDETVVIAFRGTRELIDWAVSNFKAFPVPLRDCSNDHPVWVHRGFQRTLDYRDKTTEMRSLDAILKCLEEYQLLDRNIVMTGHSLGGALAMLFAVKLRSLFPDMLNNNLQYIVTFGSPATGFTKFKEFYGELAGKTIRVVNHCDVVPFTPPLFYKHVGAELWLRHDGLRKNFRWIARLRYALKRPLSKFSSDHSMSEYIAQLGKLLKQA